MITDFLLKLFKKSKLPKIPHEIEKISEYALDFVDVGDQDSEAKHEGLASWAIKTDSKTSTYGAESNYGWVTHKGERSYKSWRNVSGQWGCVFDIKSIQNSVLKINVYDNSYSVGNKAKTTLIKISGDNQTWQIIGGFRLRGRDGWVTFSFPIDNSMLSSTKLYVLFDDTKNYYSPEHHYGKTINWISVSKNYNSDQT